MNEETLIHKYSIIYCICELMYILYIYIIYVYVHVRICTCILPTYNSSALKIHTVAEATPTCVHVHV